jgi:hypothetical protein
LSTDSSAHGPAPAPFAPPGNRWTASDLTIGSALVVLLVALFLPWFSVTVRLGRAFGLTASGTGNGPAAHGYLWVVFVLVLVALVVLISRDAISRIPGNLPSPGQMLIGAAGLSLLLCVLGVAVKPTGVSTSGSSSAVQQIVGHIEINVGWSYGGFIAVVAAAVALAAAFASSGPLHEAHRAAQAAERTRRVT